MIFQAAGEALLRTYFINLVRWQRTDTDMMFKTFSAVFWKLETSHCDRQKDGVEGVDYLSAL